LFIWTNNNQAEEKLDALDQVQGVIEFDLNGTILGANAKFLDLVGYRLDEVLGQHHRLFVAPEETEAAAYRDFWERLRSGEHQAGEFRRFAKDGSEVWIAASYNPVRGRDGRPYKAVKFAIDVTQRKADETERAGLIAAIRKSQGVIEFTLDGQVLDANNNFLALLGYSLADIQGRHHSMFMEPEQAQTVAYRDFWAALKRGEYQAAQYRRVGKGGRPIWIQASYNPILDASGRPYKVVKFATDVTDQVRLLTELRRMIDCNFGEIDQALAESATASGEAGRAAGAVNENVQLMATASEELAVSVSQISDGMTRSRLATDSAFAQSGEAGASAVRLSAAAEAMGGVVSLIQGIAGQINLLALNATIESARAGEAGRGFAVVAQEVKNLAGQASQATSQITDEIARMQTTSAQVVDALSSIRGSVEVMREQITATAAALAQQSAVTRDMSSNMQGAAQAVSGISGAIAAISAGVAQVAGAVDSTRQAAQVLAR